jgi:hypothetical protein
MRAQCSHGGLAVEGLAVMVEVLLEQRMIAGVNVHQGMVGFQ